MAVCNNLEFSAVLQSVGTFEHSITVTVPTVYECTAIQLQTYNVDNNIIQPWTTYAFLNNTTTTFLAPENACKIDIRLYKCCSTSDPGPDPNPEDPPCWPIAAGTDSCTTTLYTVTNPYRRPLDNAVSTPYNSINIPKQIQLTIDHTDCNNITAKLCAPRCVKPLPPAQMCPCNFSPYIDINTLPQLHIGRTPYGVPIDIDFECSYHRVHPQYDDGNYTNFEVYTLSRNYGSSIVCPFIDGIGYDNSNLPTGSLIKVYSTNSSHNLRTWLNNHFRFFSVNMTTTSITNVWPYTDLYWYPYDYCIDIDPFKSTIGTVYVMLVPC